MAAAAAPSEAAGLLDHCSDLKRQLVEFARSRRFSRQFDQALKAGSCGKAIDESELINIIDHFILQRPLPGERTVVETFISAHPELADADRQLLLGWRDVVEGVFEIRERDREAVIAVNLIDELTYRVCSNAGPVALARMEPGCFMIAQDRAHWRRLDAQRGAAYVRRVPAGGAAPGGSGTAGFVIVDIYPRKNAGSGPRSAERP